ncbi:MAG: hypothetical protein HY329_16810 [Chloroflexi bacterium]|nr:hypothetical protein [Chloroflexota bacterium]
MTPEEYIRELKAFITSRPHLFEEGDIFDPGPEPENGAYWPTKWGPNWSWQPSYPNDATRAFNAFVRDSQLVARKLFTDIGKPGVITSVRSMNGWWATHPNALEHETVAVLGLITVDSYPDAKTTDPVEAAQFRIAELTRIWQIWGRPVLIGELGYPLDVDVSPEVQREALARTFEQVRDLPYVVGVNYWVGAPNVTARDLTAIFTGTYGNWKLRPAAQALSDFYARVPAVVAGRAPVAPIEWRYGADRMVNGGFEEAEGWIWDAGFQRVGSAGLDSSWALRTPGQGQWENAYQAVTLNPETCYVASIYSRGSVRARLDVMNDPQWQPIAHVEIRGSESWQRTALTFSSYHHTRVVVALRDIDASGQLDLDNLTLRRCPRPALED